ncbi:helix-turn-helix domain-containing protein [uncultured Nostoc sp.]|uniref:helix-turn-helix domain-containing protein n=1 Tax=uncultured Nostoc sp. TaxID=340711 RepID=UPI0035C9C23E
MTNTYLDIERLAALVRNKRGTRGLREASAEIGNVSPSTLSRVENGSMPDMETFITLCNWLKVWPGDLFLSDHKQQQLDTAEEIVILILGDKNLEPNTAYALAQIVRATYRYLLE